MLQDKDLFPVTITKKGPLYYGAIKELFLLEKGEDLLKLYESLQIKKEEALRQFRGANLEPASPTRKTDKKSYLLICCLIVLIPVLTLLHPMVSLISHLRMFAEQVMTIPPSELILKLNTKLSKLPTDKKKEVKEALHFIAREMKPFLTELSATEVDSQSDLFNTLDIKTKNE